MPISDAPAPIGRFSCNRAHDCPVVTASLPSLTASGRASTVHAQPRRVNIVLHRWPPRAVWAHRRNKGAAADGRMARVGALASGPAPQQRPLRAPRSCAARKLPSRRPTSSRETSAAAPSLFLVHPGAKPSSVACRRAG
ncbi:hypothetical protein PsYK624_118850 [Phanerochaete sordida]|uniref:Uncharacterized protein n=1 Tax=Phanerochaete sordida TaxID=48140 RepID=A0A9P3GK13_9APHY|nr:hypothetical protein PsYK624_118850 [Phanerochaete sordida]